MKNFYTGVSNSYKRMIYVKNFYINKTDYRCDNLIKVEKQSEI